MCKDLNVVLDNDYLDNDVQCYCVDGIHGTLKELADYFNVDPISVSDLLLSGQNIQDALCMADIGFKPIISEDRPELKLNNSAESEKMSLPETKKTEKPEVKNVESKKDIIPKPVESVSNAAQDVISTKSVSDVQDLGDIIIITTTTTVVYRKAGV